MRPLATRLPALMLALMLLPTLAAASDIESLPDLAARFRAEAELRRNAAFRTLDASDAPAARALREDPSVQLMGMDRLGWPIYFQTDNLNAARTISTDDVWNAPFNLSGGTLESGRVGIWDGGGVRLTHQEFGGRVIQVDGASILSGHATHVAGTIIGAGVNLAANGMAYAAPLSAHEWTNDNAEMTTAAGNGMLVSNHSYGVAVGWSWNSTEGAWYWYGNPGISPTEDYRFGFYDADAAGWDALALAAPSYLVCKSAGNHRNETGPTPGGTHFVYNGTEWVESTAIRDPDGGATGFDTLSPRSTAKNILVVGAVNDLAAGWTAPGDVTASAFTSYGPTDDGRIKPDLVANGVGLTSAYSSGDASYASLSGTSMSTPSVTGSVALLHERYRNVRDAYPQASTMKALILHTCDEAGAADGPDYRFGWGLMNTRAAAEAIADAVVLEAVLTSGGTDEFTLIPRPGEPLRATLVWADRPGFPAADALDPTDLMLINDLDMSIDQDASTFLPWVLDPADPGAAATTGDNDRDNVEQIRIGAQGAGAITLRVTHEGPLTGSQPYSIVVTGADAPAPAWEDVSDAVLAGAEATSAVTFVDVDADGDPDLYVVNDGAANLLLRNDGGAFTDVAAGALADAGPTRAAVWGDYDNDGDRDVYLSRDGQANQLLRNDGGAFTNVATSPLNDGGAGRGVCWTDYNLDGLLDLYLVNDGTANALLRNFGDVGGGTYFFFTTGGLPANAGTGVGATWTDLDNDGDQDVYLWNRTGANVLLENAGTFGFSDITAGTLGSSANSQGAAWGDYNNDGLMDLYLANTAAADILFRNTGSGFTPVIGGAVGDTGNGVGAAWVDFDNDADLDLWVCRSNQPDLLLENDGAGGFSYVNTGLPPTAGASTACAWADYDGDGDLDVYLAADGANKLIRNGTDNGNHWLHLDLVGVDSNRDAVGARVRLTAGGVTQWREVRAGEGHLSQNSFRVAFGLGAAAAADTVEILWPAGTSQVLTGVAADRVLTVVEGLVVAVDDAPAAGGLRLLANRPNPFNPSTEIRFVLARDARVDAHVVDVAGRRVRTLARGLAQPAGERALRWDGRDDGGRALPSGAYYAVVHADGRRAVGRMTLIR
ncbi:MAG TPA: FG-GAP-like repeat-containing protein [Candidatus Krumholzibacteria bacterium]|nr:FG-GAP-like repeat-containing protein [Candidatus Krumholzibacteria bacterium]HRX50767.1 FG-GAP-like repeat-containing protein [Candidatus Krumholzibacteria bacterium]